MSGNHEKHETLENQNQEELDEGFEKSTVLIRDIAENQNAILKELQSIQGKLKRLEELTHTQRGVIEAPKNKFVLRHVFKYSELEGYRAEAIESCHEEHFGASWYMKVQQSCNSLSIWVHCAELKNKTKWPVEISEEVRLVHRSGTPARKFCHRCCITEYRFGLWPNIIDMYDLNHLYVVNDEFIIELHVAIIKTTGVYKPILRSFDDVEFSDLALLVNEKKFHVSKLFLASQSNYFKALLLGNFEESKKSEIKLRGVDENDMQKFLEVLYGENAVNDMTVEGIIFLADMYTTKLVTQKCVSFLMKDSKKSLENKLILSGKYNLEELKQQCLDKITTIEHVRSVLHGRHDMTQPILADLLEKSLSLK